MNYLKTYEGWLDIFKRKKKQPFVLPYQPQPPTPHIPDNITENDVIDIKDILVSEISIEMEEDPTGKIGGYLPANRNMKSQGGVNHRMSRALPQYFVDHNYISTTVCVASNIEFMTDEFLKEFEEFKMRLERAGFKCSESQVLKNLIYFRVSKEIETPEAEITEETPTVV